MATPEEKQRNLTAIMNWSLRQTGDATATSQFTEMDPEVIFNSSSPTQELLVPYGGALDLLG